MTTTENTERSKGTIINQDNSGTVGLGDGEVLGVGICVELGDGEVEDRVVLSTVKLTI